MGCKYTYNGTKYDSYQKLVDALMELNLEETTDLLFSKGAKQDVVYDKINALKKEINLSDKGIHLIDGGPDLAHDNNTWTTQTFIDSEYFTVNGERPVFRLNTEDYINNMKKSFVDKKEMTQEQADAWGNTIQGRWDDIAKNATDFHRLILGDSSDSLYQWSQRTKDTKFAALSEEVQKAEKDIFKEVMLFNGKRNTNSEPAGKVIKNLNFEAELNNPEGKILGHIDYLVVRPNGDIEVFCVKTSTEPYSQWSSTKIEKYKYQLALLERMLAYHGINTRHIKMNIIPVQIKYDDDFNNITDIAVQKAKSMTSKDFAYTFEKYDAVASQFIDSTVSFDSVESIKVLAQADKNLQYIFPKKNIASQGIALTAEEWITAQWPYLKPKPLPDGGYELTLSEGDVVQVKDSRKGAKNEELVKIIQDRINDEKEMFVGEQSAYNLRTELQNAFGLGYLPAKATNEESYTFLNNQFSKYFHDYTVDKDGKRNYNWEIIESAALDAANIIAFRNKKTKQLDVFAVTGANPDTICRTRAGRDNLLGYYITDRNDYNFLLKGNYGNVDAIRVMAVLNEVLPEVDGDIHLGNLKVIGPRSFSSKKGAFFEFNSLLEDWDTIIQIVNKNTDANISNKIRSNDITCIRSEEVLQQTLIDALDDQTISDASEIKALEKIINGGKDSKGIQIEGLMQVQTIEGKIEKLELLQDRLRTIAAEERLNITDSESLLRAAASQENPKRAAIAKLFIVTSHALSLYYGDIPKTNEKFSSMQEYLMPGGHMSNTAIRRAVEIIRVSFDNVRYNVQGYYMDHIFPKFMDFYKDAGYTKAQNAIVGNQSVVYKNLFVYDDNGHNTFIFKNPYDDTEDLKSHERKFLKGILYEMYKIKCNIMNRTCDIEGENDEKLLTKMPKDYLWVPLQASSKATRRTNIANNLKQSYNKLKRLITNPKEGIAETWGMFDSEDADRRDYAAIGLRLYNPYTRSLLNMESRTKMIAARGEDFFETNVENIFTDFLTKQVECKELEGTLMRIKGIELALTLRGTAEGDDQAIAHTIKAIDDFVTINIYGRSIMEDTSQKLMAYMEPFRRLVSKVYIAGNLAGAVRDTLQGIEANFFRAAIKFQTDIDMKDVAFGYAQVMKEGVTNIMTMSKLNQFNIKYAFSNFDAAKIAERLKTNRGGVLNAENWMYWTLRAPDYLNRMVLFIAKAHHDGAYEAYSLDENHRLKYDWRKDKRFSVYASGDTSNPEYKKQQALYMSKIRQFNIENRELKLSYDDPLPDAYTPSEIRRIKVVGESIYGAYDMASRSKLEQIFIGRNFTYFFTWMNGMEADYFKGLQISQNEAKEVQETDYDGKPLFFEDDGSGNTTTRDTGLPVFKYVPLTVQGIVHTLHTGLKELYHGGWNDMKSAIWTDPVERRNLRRLFGDMLMMAFYTILFKGFIDDSYKEHKTNDVDQAVATNLLWELAYKGGKQSYDVFSGPIALMNYFGENTTPTAYTLQVKLVKDAWNYISGKKDLGSTIMNSQAFFRSMRDSYMMYMKSQA